MPFRFTINPYRGCSHACTYCFARPTHEYLGLNGGEDFERRIVVKVNAVERLRAELARPSWGGEHIAMGTNTDPYQRPRGATGSHAASSRRSAEARNPFSILTKSTMVLRDVDVLVAAAQADERARELLDRHARRGGLADQRARHAAAAASGSRRSRA